MGYVDSVQGTSEKNVQIKLYSYSEKGMVYVLKGAQDEDVVILEVNQAKFPSFKVLVEFNRRVEPELSMKFFSYIKNGFSMTQSDDEETQKYNLYLLNSVLQNFTASQRRRMARIFYEINPDTRRFANSLKKQFEELFSDLE